MHFDPEPLVGMSPGEQFVGVLRVLQRLDSPLRRRAAACAVFDLEGMRIVDMLEAGDMPRGE